MKLFISYPSDLKDIAEQLRPALESEGHAVFTDRSELKEGEPYHEALREAIEDCDALVFLITPRSIRAGSYALTELDIAQRRWRSPGGRVLPVIAQPTPIEDIPPYLRSVTLLQPKGDRVAETVAAVDRLRGALPLKAAGRRGRAGAGSLRCLARLRPRRAEARAGEGARRTAGRRTGRRQPVVRGRQPCGGVAAVRLAGGQPTRRRGRAHRPRRLRHALAARGAGGRREGDLRRAGGADPAGAGPGHGRSARPAACRSSRASRLGRFPAQPRRRGGGDPPALYKAALADDAGNVYAHSMWAHWIVWHGGRLDEAVRQHFEAAEKSNRDRPWLRRMQFAVAMLRGELNGYALEVLNQMRAAGEQPDTTQRDQCLAPADRRGCRPPSRSARCCSASSRRPMRWPPRVAVSVRAGGGRPPAAAPLRAGAAARPNRAAGRGAAGAGRPAPRVQGVGPGLPRVARQPRSCSSNCARCRAARPQWLGSTAGVANSRPTTARAYR
ncbi:toll/interleukin-1 receptor domain-containing protein [Piscinibacter aquaticus]|uniref:Toll/interleukin-1 receptor domain-containing protein n=1 Tax=Piscinibacter aquaticus TaxID=392597 RepID=A0A5C6U1E7_9BURK|nr:toll/interleukin-1 receptor domain-containing protein [Piscinibacter aquaticus]